MQHYAHLSTDSVELAICLTDKLKKQQGNLEKFGWLTISTGYIADKDISWDNLDFFLSCDYASFKDECNSELREKGFKPKKIFKQIKQLLKEANKLNIL